MADYGSAVSRIALHAPPEVVEAWRCFQEDATTTTDDGRARLVSAIQAARQQLGHGDVDDNQLHVLLFGADGAGRVEFEFERVLSEVHDQIGDQNHALTAEASGDPLAVDDLVTFAKTEPALAVLEGYVRLERELQALLHSSYEDERYDRMSGGALARAAGEKGLVSPETVKACNGLTVLRNLVVGSPSNDVTEERARDYLALVDALLYAIRQKAAR